MGGFSRLELGVICVARMMMSVLSLVSAKPATPNPRLREGDDFIHTALRRIVLPESCGNALQPRNQAWRSTIYRGPGLNTTAPASPCAPLYLTLLYLPNLFLNLSFYFQSRKSSWRQALHSLRHTWAPEPKVLQTQHGCRKPHKQQKNSHKGDQKNVYIIAPWRNRTADLLIAVSPDTVVLLLEVQRFRLRNVGSNRVRRITTVPRRLWWQKSRLSSL